jgi:cell fate regulator YaaT (PSP1 superfamily)
MTENNKTIDKNKKPDVPVTENNKTIDKNKKPDVPVKQDVVGIRFKSCGKVYTFAVNGLDLKPGTKVVVDSDAGLSLAHVATPKHTVEKAGDRFKKVVRVATDEDFETIEKNRSFESDAKAFCVEKAKELNLPMKIVSTETTLEKKRLIFYFTADGRIDFRELVRDLAAKYKTRIEMRQIGVRDQVKLLGGIGACGRQTCCNLFLTSFAPVTIRMAKQQDLSINQSKLSGICGRLMCCLRYEFKDIMDDAKTKQNDEDFITITDETSDDDLLSIDSEVVHTDKTDELEHPAGSGDSNIQLKKEIPDTSKPEKTGRQRRRRRRGRGRRIGGKTPEKATSAEGNKTGTSQDKGQKQTGQAEKDKDKGKSFSRRRRFWKKKKKQQPEKK